MIETLMDEIRNMSGGNDEKYEKEIEDLRNEINSLNDKVRELQ